jgi:hypothetical protein
MFLIREVMQCRPGKVRDMVNKFKGLNAVAQRLGYQPFRLFTDVSGEPFWTVVAESEVRSLGDFLEMEEKVMADDEARQAMAGYHELVQNGRREIYRVEG